MRLRSSPLVLFLLFSFALADLPSCYRARCSHCRIQFISQMCPQTCTNCPAQTFGKAVNNAGTTIVAHGQPTATVYRTADHVQALSQQDGQTQTAFAQPQQTQFSQVASYQQHSQAPTPLQQQVAAQPASTPTFQQQNINQFGQPAYNNQYAQNQFVQQPFGQPGQFSFPTAATLPPPPQATQFGGFAQGQQTAAQFPGFNQQPQQPFNPFQPFQPFQAQQQPQTPYNPFTFPTLPPAATFAPFTPAPVSLPTMGTFPTFAQFPTHPPLTQAPQPPVTQAPQPANNYQQPQYNVQPASNNYIQSGHVGTHVVEPQRPRQLYNTQQQAGGAQQVQTPGYVNTQQSQTSYLQPARSNAIPTVQVGNNGQPARSIDSAPLQLEKQAYIGKELPPAFINQCPKQPNWEPCITKDLANERFRNCCQRLGEGCSQLCNYDQSLTTVSSLNANYLCKLFASIFKNLIIGRCPIGKVADMMICASGYEDATPCCQAYGVFEPGFEHCRPYCNPAAGLPSDGNLAEKYKCLGKLSQIQRCFYVHQKP
ncbi:protein of unknown function DB domain-containing protein [Aphelenchoides bicaudatus]|nr:protein of unknown function DB domain-containing protein [Aphelenchoides bicaudatus]